MKDPRPPGRVIRCPECGAFRVNRRRKRCYFCKVALYYYGEFMVDESGYLYTRDGWIPVKNIVARSRA